jgi:psiF repeat
MERLPEAYGLRGITLRFSSVAAVVCLCLAPVAGGFAAAPPAPLADAPTAAVPATGVSAAAKPSPAAVPAPSSGDAAAKHAKRTACLKEAKAKKLVGADKTSFLKTCIAAPAIKADL